MEINAMELMDKIKVLPELSDTEKEEQRISVAYGNCALEDSSITLASMTETASTYKRTTVVKQTVIEIK